MCSSLVEHSPDLRTVEGSIPFSRTMSDKVHHWPDKPPADHYDPETLSGHLWCGLAIGPGRGRAFKFRYNKDIQYPPISYNWSNDLENVTCKVCLQRALCGPEEVAGVYEVV